MTSIIKSLVFLFLLLVALAVVIRSDADWQPTLRFSNRRQFERPIQWAVADDAGQQEYGRQNAQDDGQCAINRASKVKNSHRNGEDETDDAIDGSHILSHDCSPC